METNDLCIECLVRGDENPSSTTTIPSISHTVHHKYRIMDQSQYLPLFDPEWTALEELKLVEGMEKHGLENWEEISTYIGTKTLRQCAEHYRTVYLSSSSTVQAPLPVPLPSLTHTTTVSSSSVAAVSDTAHTSKPSSNDITMEDTNNNDPQASSSSSLNPSSGGISSSSTNAAASSATGTRINRKKKDLSDYTTGTSSAVSSSSNAAVTNRNSNTRSGHVSATPGYSSAHVPRTDVAGYMPLRGDFDVEYDNDAELVLADMDFAEGEHATETELKLKILEIYNAKLDERERRKAFIIERGLLDYKRLLSMERRRPKDEREIYDALRPFARFMTPQEHEDLVRGIIMEQRLRKRIAQLQEYRKNGIRSLAEAQEYENQKRKREQASSLRRQSSGYEGRNSAVSSGTNVGGSTTTTAALRGGNSSTSNAAAITSSSSTTTTTVNPAPNDNTGSRSNAAEQFAAAAMADELLRSRRGAKRRANEANNASSSSISVNQANLLATQQNSSTVSFTVNGMPGADRLNDKERALCEHLRLLPNQYFQIKSTIINISLVRGYVRKHDSVEKLLHIDATKIGDVYDFVVTCGWANPKVDAND